MKRKPIKVDWDELEAAFDNKRKDLVYYLDLVTGEVILEGEGEEEGPEVDEDKEAVEDDVIVRPETTRLYVEAPGPEIEVGWMEDFVDVHDDLQADVVSNLEEALVDAAPIDAFREVLRADPSVRDRWFLYRSDRLHEAIDAWIEANHVHPTEPPPWRV